MYENGRGVLRDIEEAKKWYRKAAEKGDQNAKKALERLKNVHIVPSLRQQLEGVNFLQYVVKSGDSLGKIAYDHGITIKELKELNNIVYNKVRIGQILRVPIKSKCNETNNLSSISNKKIESAAREDARPPISQSVSKVQLWEGGPYWADRNIGADKPADSGYYFWWGDTVGYKREGDRWVASDGSNSNFSFSEVNTPTYNKDKSTLQSEGWITADGVLSTKHDAAQRHWGGDWRMPTDQEFKDLESKCDWSWTSVNGVKGYVVSGKGEYSSKSIFLPCAGYGYGTSLDNAGSNGYYWSSVLFSFNFSAWYLYFNSGYHYTLYNYRSYGRSVRPLTPVAPTESQCTSRRLTDNEIKALLSNTCTPNQLKDNEEQRCISLIQRRFYECWTDFNWSENLSSVHLNVKFGAGGRILWYRIVRSSGDAKVDQSVLAAAKRAGYVAGLSADFLKKYAEITIVMTPKRQ